MNNFIFKRRQSGGKDGEPSEPAPIKKEEIMAEEPKVKQEVKVNGTPPAPTPKIEIPVLDLEEYVIPDEKGGVIKDESKGSTKYAFIGSGQAGGRIAKSFYDLGYKKVIVLNTSKHDLDLLDLPPEQKFFMDIGEEGAGKDMTRGAAAAKRYQQEIFDMLRRLFGPIDQLLVCVGAGGGTGGGSIAQLLGVTRKYLRYLGHSDINERMGAIVTLPTAGEANSPLISSNAKKVITEIGELAEKKYISPLIIIDNDKIAKMYSGLTPKEFWPKINSTVSNLFDIFNRLSALPSQYTSFDTTDYLSVVRGGGCMIFGLSRIKDYKTEDKISQTLKNNLYKTLLASGFDLATAKTAAAIVVAGKDIMATEGGLMDRINYAFDCMSNLCPNATVHRGIYEDDRNSVRIYTIISGLKMPMDRINRLMV